MPRYVALLRGVSPMNAKMPELKRCFEDAGFGNVRTLLSSGNVAFDSYKADTLARLEREQVEFEDFLRRLRAFPRATLCIECKQREERR